MSRVVRGVLPEFEMTAPVIVVGAGGCGLTAALAVRDAGVEVLVLERDASPMGSTAMSTGLIPAAMTPEQTAQGIDDSPALMAADIVAKTKNRTDPAIALRLAEESADTVAWLRDAHGVPLALVDGFLYPGHSRRRMYGTPNRSGTELMGALQAAAAGADADLLSEAVVDRLFIDDEDRVRGVEIARPDGARERIGCDALILASCGYGGHAQLVRRWIPEMAEAVYHGHPGNQGDAVEWGGELGALLTDMTGYQGHGGLAVGHAVPILWPLIMEGGYQVNLEGRRFSNEAEGYSEQAAKVNAQPGHVAWSIFDERLNSLMLAFDDYRDALAAGAVIEAGDIADLAVKIGVPEGALTETMDYAAACTRGVASDPWGRDFTGRPPLAAPYRAAKVTGALFHTQGGLAVDGDGRVLREDGSAFPNLFAGGGAARGVSGPDAGGYLAGNGLLTATTFGKLAGRAAARLVKA